MLHECDNRICVNPSHLTAGSYADNMADMVTKQREAGCASRPGESNPAAKLTQQQVDAIRQEVEEVLEAEALFGVPKRGYLSRIARRHGVSPSTVSLVARGKTWKGTTVPIVA